MKRFEYTPEQYIDNVKEGIRDIVADLLGLEIEEFNDFSRFINDLGADELDLVELAMEVEKKFNISLPDEELLKIMDDGDFTFGKFVCLIKEIKA